MKTEPAWYCLRTHAKHEHIAAAHLRQLAGVEVFNPQLRLLRSTRRGRVVFTEPLFPNYLFGRFVLGLLFDKVSYTPAVKMILRFGDRVPSIPDAVVEDLRSSLTENPDRTFTDGPVAGEEIEVVAGPFEGVKGCVTRLLPAKQRVNVLLQVMGQAVPTELSLECVRYRRTSAAHMVCGAGELPALDSAHAAGLGAFRFA